MITSAFWRADSACTAEAGTEREIGARLELQCQKVRERKQALNTLSLSLSMEKNHAVKLFKLQLKL